MILNKNKRNRILRRLVEIYDDVPAGDAYMRTELDKLARHVIGKPLRPGMTGIDVARQMTGAYLGPRGGTKRQLSNVRSKPERGIRGFNATRVRSVVPSAIETSRRAH